MSESENVSAATAEEPHYSAFRYALGAVLAFFGFSSKTHRASKKRSKLVGDIVTYIILLAGAFVMIYPFWWMIAASFAYTSVANGQEMLERMVWWAEIDTTQVPSGAAGGFFYNYVYLFSKGGKFETSARITYWRALGNNLLYSIVPVVVGVITSASAAFAFSKINWYGRDVVFMFLLAAIMIPGPSIMIVQYCMYSAMGWLTNGLAMIIPGLFGSIMTAFFIRQFLYGLPTSIVEAAKIDGAGYFRIFVSFILPLAMPAIMAQGLLSFMGCWNNYLGSYLFTKGDAINLPYAMVLLQEEVGDEDMAPVMAGSVLCLLPVIILFGIFQKQIIGSLMLTGSKE